MHEICGARVEPDNDQIVCLGTEEVPHYTGFTKQVDFVTGTKTRVDIRVGCSNCHWQDTASSTRSGLASAGHAIDKAREAAAHLVSARQLFDCKIAPRLKVPPLKPLGERTITRFS